MSDFKWGDAEVDYFNIATKREKEVALANAVIYKKWDLVNWIIEQGVDINSIMEDLIIAPVLYQEEDMVEKLIELKYDVNKFGCLAFREAVRTGNEKIVKMLFKAGADVNAFNGDAMIIAAGNADIAMIRLLHSFGANANHERSLPLIRACSNKDEKKSLLAVKELIDFGSTFNDPYKLYLAAHEVVRKNNLELGKFLIEQFGDAQHLIEVLEVNDGLLEEGWQNIIEGWALQ